MYYRNSEFKNQFITGIRTFFLAQVLLFSSFKVVKCQSSLPKTVADSLLAVWNDPAQADTSRLKAIDSFAWDGYMFSQPDSAFYYAKLMFDFAQSKGLEKQMAGALSMQGISFYFRGDYIKALQYFKQSLKIAEEIPQPDGKVGDKKGIAGNLNLIGNIYFEQGDYPKALNYYQRGFKIKQEIGDEKGAAALLNNIGLIYSTQGETVQALDYYERSLRIKEKYGGYQLDIATSYSNIADIYYNQGKTIQAKDYYERGLAVSKENGDKKGTAASLQGLGFIYNSLGETKTAKKYFTDALKIQEEIGDKKAITTSITVIGDFYNKQKDYKKAIESCNRGLKLSEEIGAIALQKTACQCLYDAYKGLGNGNKALFYHEEMLVLTDSLQREETAKILQQMEFNKQVLEDSLEVAEKERLIEVAHQDEVRKKDGVRNIAIGVGILVLILAGGIYSRLRYTKKAKAIIEKEKDRSENLLLNILPADIAAELKEKGRAEARDFDLVSILFTDFKGFTAASEKLSAQDLVSEINTCFEAFDGIMGKYNIEKIKTIGDAYMAAGGLPIPTNDSVKNTVLAAIEMQAFISKRKVELDAANKPCFEMRLGIHTGPVVAGIVGVKKFAYDIWGDTVNTASRMESSGEVGKVNISQSTYEVLRNDIDFTFESRGKIEAKGKGEIAMYFVSKN
ncbi:MAG: adenylate/guanylate cyclase domain-containing protein [Bacteroidia bacterium]